MDPSRHDYDLTSFHLSDLVRCAAHARTLGEGLTSMEQVADRVVDFLYGSFRDPITGRAACALVRFFETESYSVIPGDRRLALARQFPDADESPSMKYLVLLATRGDEKAWNDPAASRSHGAIPLPSEEIVEQAPMIARMIKQLGLPIQALISSDPGFLLEAQQTTFNIFHVAEAIGSPYIPAQKEFVEPYGIHSVLGFGGLLPSGNLFVTVMFARVSIPHETAELFRTLALNVKLALLPFAGDRVFSAPVQGRA
ncbi:MAG TPA: hypothetical protein VNM92_00475 [Thermoanaerobaculia bacterium]|nr:hypothetical protein [Thermoanaerobaculia bacterium]